MAFAFRIQAFLVFLAPLLLVSCIEIRDPNKVKAQETQTENSPVAEVTPLDQPNQYLVTIKGVTPVSVVTRNPVAKPHDILEHGTSALLTVKNLMAEDNVTEPGRYIYSVQQDGRTYELPVEVPKDYVFEGEQSLDQMMDATMSNDKDPYRKIQTEGRVFFRAGATLTTNGENVQVIASMIDSEGATVQTFQENQTARQGQAGRGGGKVKLTAKSIRGTLHVKMRGENGGEASPWDLSRTRFEDANVNGYSGGNSGSLIVEIENQTKGIVTFDLAPGRGSPGLTITRLCFEPHPKERTCDQITARPENRKAGVKGLDGVAEQPTGILQALRSY